MIWGRTEPFVNIGTNGQLEIAPSAPSFIPGVTKHEGTNLSPSCIRARSLPSLHSSIIPSTGDEVGRPPLGSPSPRPSTARKSASLPNLRPSQILHRVTVQSSHSRPTSPAPSAHDDHTYDENLDLSTGLPPPIPANLSSAWDPDSNANPEHHDVLLQPRSSLGEEPSKPPGRNTAEAEVISGPLDMVRDSGPKDNSIPTPPKVLNSSTSPDPQLRTFNRFRQSLLAATRTRTKYSNTDASGLSANTTKVPKRRENKSGIVQGGETKMLPKVTFKLMNRGDVSTPGKGYTHQNPEPLPSRETGSTRYLTPTLRSASLSSPALHLYPRDPSDESPTPEVVSSTSNFDVPVSPQRKSSKPQPLPGGRPSVLIPGRTSQETTGESKNAPGQKPGPTQTPRKPAFTRRRDSMEFEVPESSPLPAQPLGTFLGSASTSHLPLSPPAPTPVTSPISRHDPTAPKVVRPSPTPTPRRSSVEGTRPTLSPSRLTRPPVPARYQINASRSPRISASPSSPARGDRTSNLEHRDLLRQATSILCKELLERPGHNVTQSGIVEQEEIELRLRALARLERVWRKSGSVNANGVSDTSGSVAVGSNLSSVHPVNIAGEDRERRLFSDGLRDGYVLCQ